jgi:GH24 family phage-related lysozyme (muramidase)
MTIIASPRHASDKCLALIKQFEGCKLTAYPDPGSGGDPWTIGWGSTGPDIRKGLVWTQAQCDERLEADVQRFALQVDKLIGPASTTQSEFDALVSFAYNLGLGNLSSSTLLKLHKAGKHPEAAGQFVRWNRASGQVMRGLTLRREAEAELYRSAP